MGHKAVKSFGFIFDQLDVETAFLVAGINFLRQKTDHLFIQRLISILAHTVSFFHCFHSKHAYLNRIEPEALPFYQQIFELVKEKSHFILTTNVDHQFWKAGFMDERIFATQGDYGEIQCARGCHDKVYDAKELFGKMGEARKDCKIPSELVPKCPVCGGNMAMHLRSDQYFVEDAHWNEAAGRYEEFLEAHQAERVVLLELGVGFNTPGIVKFSFWRMTAENPWAVYACVNLGEAGAPREIANRSICIDGDIGEVLKKLK